VGIELVPVFAHPAVFFGQIVNPGQFDIALFTYINPPDPGTNVEIWRCHGTQNLTGYCNRQVSRELLDSNRALDPSARAVLLNKADALIAADLPAIPLFEKPAFVAFKKKLHGVVVNDAGEGWLWNAGDWWLSS
jgi:peptide/nickel transport system substrate-binding protein